ncbi:ATP-binding protein [Actinoallomurus iriomotensis]|uniref:Histidine kinase/HSP90-like ATPase domain-containing protein n=1 Tax=Actinoallomurus iriomotensis TaxID=478107 RepID=A0A9W6S4W3_9ACTN|nr:ATP-binding protein [Actinoallomurus iriomotensis]GLY85797.1 hypothetical protein Airi02_037260 [Actinoallomurus iriomotensis]
MDRCNAPQFGLILHNSDNPLRQERCLPPFLASAGVARDFVASRLRRWGRSHQVDDGVQLVSEMFNNALIHAPSADYVVAVDWNGGRVRLEIWDSSPHRPIVLPLDFEQEHGRGMHLISALAESWGCHVATSGKCVWAILAGTPKTP